jgi:hypothetical protein
MNLSPAMFPEVPHIPYGSHGDCLYNQDDPHTALPYAVIWHEPDLGYEQLWETMAMLRNYADILGVQLHKKLDAILAEVEASRGQ